jgi:hypothetical protein
MAYFRPQLPPELEFDTDRPTLDRARYVERAAHGQKWPLVIEHAHPLGIEKDAVLDVVDEGVVGPAIP